MADNANKPAPTKVWENPKVLTELCVALYQALDTSGGLSGPMKNAIEAYLESQETPVTWNAVRRKTMAWDAKVHEDILIEVFQSVNLSSSDVSKLMGGLEAKGYTFTESALRQHIQKLRKTRDTAGITGANGGTSTPKKTPTKKTPASTPKKRTASGKPKKSLSKETVDEGDEVPDDEFDALVKKEYDDMEDTPTKKIKIEVAEEADDEF